MSSVSSKIALNSSNKKQNANEKLNGICEEKQDGAESWKKNSKNLEVDLKAKTMRPDRKASPHREQDPFMNKIMKAKVPKDFKAPDMTPYDGRSDLSHHLSNLRCQMYLTDASKATRCKAFPTTLTKTVIKWFDSLPQRSITSFDNLAKKFLARFSIQKDKAKHAPSLVGIKQGDQKSLRSYMERFNKACLNIQNLPIEAAIMGLINDLREGPFSHSISRKQPTSLNEVEKQAEKYINMEENSQFGETSKVGFPYPSRDKDKESRKKEDQPTEKPRKYHNYTPLWVSLVDVYRKICNTEKIPPSRPIKHKRRGSRTEYCEYHRIYGHPTNEFYDLKNVIEKLAREGKLDRFLANRTDELIKRKRDEEGERAERPPHTLERRVHMINGGFTGGEISKSSAKDTLKKYTMLAKGIGHPTSLLFLSPKKMPQASSLGMLTPWLLPSYWLTPTSTEHWLTREAPQTSYSNPPSTSSDYKRRTSEHIPTAYSG
ncbi:uncharacterized protein LOC107478960 [Arachis duranensis]|uniref:Uncharacterized protein LOC107478960 n=1 Tax=Arachis duranensis TaxID=130453 RepID=A0A6P4CQ81_ARADU|nr:uncharacterized protein LOC107478960 [Arachis duranensis]